MRRYRLWCLFAVGILSFQLGIYSLYLEYVRRGWPITNAHVFSLEHIDISRKGPQEDHFLLEVGYHVYDIDVEAKMDGYGHMPFKAGDIISVKVDPDSLKHFVFH